MTDLSSPTKALILLVAGIFIGAVAFGAAHALVAVATWVWGAIGPWSLVLAALGLAWVGHAEMRRAK